MKQLPLILILCFLAYTSRSQVFRDFSAVDQYAGGVTTNNLQQLAQQLTDPFPLQLEKVRSIFRWISLNISYNTGRLPVKSIRIDKETDTSSTYIPLNIVVGQKVLSRRTAVCDGYSRLFSALCSLSGIESEVITGYARNGQYNRFNSNHTWNAVHIDGNWYLLDATWASGYFTYFGNDFIQEFNERYFLTDPKEFIKDHLPENLKWTLINELPFYPEYNSSPFRYSGFVRSKIKSFYPQKGVIYAAVGDSIQIVLETDDAKKQLLVVDTTYDEEHAFELKNDAADISVYGKKIVATYIVKDEKTEWLNIILNDRNILRYKLNVRRKETGLASMK